MRRSEITGCIVDRFGGKAEGLSRLAAVNAPIPPTLCLSANKNDIGGRHCINDLASIVRRWMGNVGIVDKWIVRSSHSQEDSLESSSAGLYPSRIVENGAETSSLHIAQTIYDILSILLRNSFQASVILQPFITGDVSGVVFSSDPNEGKCGSGILAMVNGPCSNLVDGTATPTTVNFVEGRASSFLPPKLSAYWDRLIGFCISIERQWGVPVDCEFTISESGELFLLQARPVSALTRWKSIPYLLEVRHGNQLPASVEAHPKVQLRVRCQRSNIFISPAWIATETQWSKLPQFEMPTGSYTSVLLHPRLLNGRVKRKFSNDGYSGTATVLNEASNYWVRHAILTSLIPSSLTGIAASQKGIVVIEVGKGHFIPKGLVDTTVYEVEGADIRLIQQPLQQFYFDVNPETGEAEKVDYGAYNSLSGDQLQAISEMVRRLQLDEGDCLEFGISNEGTPFVIDIQRGQSETQKIVANRQVLSPGEAEGDLLLISTPTSDGADDHFFEFAIDFCNPKIPLQPVVIAAIRPQLGLLREFENLAKEGKRVVGAIFEVYSPLSHLSVLLREWGIPAIVFPQFRSNELSQAETVRIFASNEGGIVLRTDYTRSCHDS